MNRSACLSVPALVLAACGAAYESPIARPDRDPLPIEASELAGGIETERVGGFVLRRSGDRVAAHQHRGEARGLQRVR